MKKMRVKICLCILLVAPFTILYSSDVSAKESINIKAAQDVVNIPDPVLKSYLNGLLGQSSTSDITEAQMDTITDVTINNSSLVDLTGLDYAHNLTRLQLYRTGVTDYSLIANILSLTHLSISGNNLTNQSLPDLNGLENLINLYLNSGKLDDNALTKFNRLPKLTSLNLDSNPSITDILPLKSLPNLDVLFIQFCGVNDFRGIDTFPKLTTLAAYGQNVGSTVLINSTIKSSSLVFNEVEQTIFVPFTLMTERSVNFDGYLFPFTTDTGASRTYFTLNGVQINGSRLEIDETGITVSGITKDYFDSITKMEYNAYYNNPAGSYATPANFSSYSVSGGTYDHYFDIDHSLTITNEPEISYPEQTTVSEAQFLQDIDAKTDDGTPVTSDFNSVVDFNTPGDYTVTLNAENAAGLKADPTQVIVTILAKPVITADKSISYTKDTSMTEQQFLKDISAKTSDGSKVTSDFESIVDLSKIGTYKVTLNAVSENGIEADPVIIMVTVVADSEPPTPPGPEPSPTPDPDNPIVIDTSNSSAQSNNSTTKSTAEKTASDKSTLPNTGDFNQVITVSIGIIIIGIATVLFRIRKHN